MWDADQLAWSIETAMRLIEIWMGLRPAASRSSFVRWMISSDALTLSRSVASPSLPTWV